MTAGVGGNRDRLVSESNKPPCDSALTGQPDNATLGQNKHAGWPQLIMPMAITKQITAGLTGANSLSRHIVIYIIIICHM